MTHTAEKKIWVHIVFIFLAVFVAYFNIFHAPFSTWDDDLRVVNNPDITSMDRGHALAWFSHFYVGVYEPLPMFFYAVGFALGKLEPFIYHTINIALHAVNTVILYFLIIKIQKNYIVALFTSLLFALHPVQTEGVSWIAELHTVLCAFFYLLALLQYASFLSDANKKRFVAVFLFGVAAMLSKALAVTLPVSLLVIHIWMNKSIRVKSIWIVMCCLFMASLATGIIAIQGQATDHWLNKHSGFNLWETTLIAGYTYVQYIVHLILPVRLCVMYPYPTTFAFIHYLYLAFAMGIVLTAIIAWRRKWHMLLGGILFYTINIVMLLQFFIQYGEYMMADRFLYIAGIGIIFPLVYYPVTWLENRGRQIIAIGAYTVIALCLLVATFVRNNIWTSEINFVNSIVEQFPNSAVAQYSLGALYMKTGNYQDAETHISEAVLLDPQNYKAWYDKGVLYLRESKVNESLDALNKCLDIYPYADAYFSRALLYMGTGRPSLALADVEKTLTTQSRNARAWYIKANCMEQAGDIASAIDNYTTAIGYENNEPLFYLKRGQAYIGTNQNQQALNDFNKVIAIDPSNGTAFYYRGIIKYQRGQSPCNDFKAAMARGYKVPADILGKMCREIAPK